MRQEYLARSGSELQYSRFQAPQHVSGFEQPLLIYSRKGLLIGNDMQVVRVAHGRLGAVLQQICGDATQICLGSFKTECLFAQPREAKEYVLYEIVGFVGIARSPRKHPDELGRLAAVELGEMPVRLRARNSANMGRIAFAVHWRTLRAGIGIDEAHRRARPDD